MVAITESRKECAKLCHDFLTEPLTKYHCGYRLDGSDDSYNSIKTSLFPEFKSNIEVTLIMNLASSIVELQRSVKKIIERYPELRNMIMHSSPRSEVDLFSFAESDPILTVQRIDYIIDQNNKIFIIDPNILPLGLGFFDLRSEMIVDHLDELSTIVTINKAMFNKSAKFDLKSIANELTCLLESYHCTKQTPVYLITEKNYNNNLDHEYVCRKISKFGVKLKLAYIEDLDIDKKNSLLINNKTNEIIKFIWRYGRFSTLSNTLSGWSILLEAINLNYVVVINKPGIYTLENKLFLSLLSVSGFDKLLLSVGVNYNFFNLSNHLPKSLVIKTDKISKVAYTIKYIHKNGNIIWKNFDLVNLPRSFVFKTPDTSGGKGVRFVLNESNTKGQKYFWKFVGMFPEYDVFIISDFIKPKKRMVIDPNSKKLFPEKYIFKDDVFFISNRKSLDVIGFSAFARKNSYKIHGSEDTISVVQFYEKY